jgi:hypothetical protein
LVREGRGGRVWQQDEPVKINENIWKHVCTGEGGPLKTRSVAHAVA